MQTLYSNVADNIIVRNGIRIIRYYNKCCYNNAGDKILITDKK